jgi:FKBP-type peptidyl-prolyl cis-trans isomerase
MKKPVIILAAIVLTISACNNGNKESKIILNNQIDSVAYAIGVDQGMRLTKGLETFPDSLNFEAIIAGFTQSMRAGEVLFDEETGRQILTTYMEQKQAEELANQKTKFSGNLEIGNKWLAENATQPGIMVTASGLQYKVIIEGNGQKPIDGDIIIANYEGKLIDGTIFDSSYERGEPMERNVNQLIPGFTEGLKLMPVGSTYMFYIPQDIAYGENVRPGGPIEPFSALIFKVELLNIAK